jgi:hypothetical protein
VEERSGALGEPGEPEDSLLTSSIRVLYGLLFDILGRF